MDTQLKKGLLEICVLAAIRKEDSYGYKIVKDISPYIAISESTLYPILRRLESSECLRIYTVEHNSRLRKYYKITELGMKRIDEFLQGWQAMLDIYNFIEGEDNDE